MLLDLALESLVLAASHVCELDPLGSRGSLGVEEDRQVIARGDPLTERSSEFDAVVDRRGTERHERDDIDGPDAGVLPGVGFHVDLVDGGHHEALERLRHGTVLTGHREHRPVVAGVAGPVEQIHAVTGLDGLGEPVDDVEPATLGDVRHRFDQHPTMLVRGGARRRVRAHGSRP